MGNMFDAVSIENSIARFAEAEIGERGTPWDADIFRSGNHENLAHVLNEIIESLELRTQNIGLQNTDFEPGKVGAQLNVAIDRLKKISGELANSQESEPNDYHWSVVASLLTVINTLLVVIQRS